MLNKLNQLLCFHRYKPRKLYYTLTKMEDSTGLINLYAYNKCSKCDKEESLELSSFFCRTEDEIQTIIDMLENHKAVYYLQFVSDLIEGKV